MAEDGRTVRVRIDPVAVVYDDILAACRAGCIRRAIVVAMNSVIIVAQGIEVNVAARVVEYYRGVICTSAVGVDVVGFDHRVARAIILNDNAVVAVSSYSARHY